MATEEQMIKTWARTHTIEKQRIFGDIELSKLKKGESVVMGDGKTYFWLLTEKPKPECISLPTT